MRKSRLNWSARPDGDSQFIELAGDIDEDANFEELENALKGKPTARIDLRGIERINSIGVREWVNFIRRASESTAITLERCSSVVVTQLNMIANFAGKAVVASIVAPYVCDACGNEEDVLLNLTSVDPSDPNLATRPCPECSESMELDDLPESYFAFATVSNASA